MINSMVIDIGINSTNILCIFYIINISGMPICKSSIITITGKRNVLIIKFMIKKNDKSFYDGVKMTIGDFNSLFAKLNIEKIDPKEGDMFDHNLHEAISRAPSDLDVGAIVKVIRCGYSLHGRLLRPAMVVVSAGK